MRTPREPSARANPSPITRRVFVKEVLFGSRARDGVMWSQRGEKIFVHRAGVAVVALGFEAPTLNSAREVGSRLEIGRDRRQ